MEPVRHGRGEHTAARAAGGRRPRAALGAPAHARLRRRLLDRRGPLRRDRRPAAGRHPGRAAARRLPAAVLRAPARVDLGLREHGDRHARAVAAVRGARRPGRLVGRARPVRAARRAHGRAARGHQPVPDPLRAGDADVRAGGAARHPGLRGVRAGLRAHGRPGAAAARAAPALGGRVRGRAGRADVHAQLGAVLRRGLRADVARAAGRRARRGAARAAARRRCSASAARSCCSRRGCRRWPSRSSTPAPRGPRPRPGATCSACPAGCWGRPPSSACCSRRGRARWSCSRRRDGRIGRAGPRAAGDGRPVPRHACWRPTRPRRSRPRGRCATSPWRSRRCCCSWPAGSRTRAGSASCARCWSR